MPEQLSPARSGARRHVLTVALEDYFHVGAFNRLIQRGEWYRFESRLDVSVRATLDLLAECHASATFFVLGWVADSYPELVRAVAAAGHEIASKGFYHRSIRHMSPSEFREDLARARESLERAAGQQVRGYRVADRWLEPPDLWALQVLAEEGYAYDSSIAPMLRRYADQPWRIEAHENRFDSRVLWEFPISTAGVAGLRVPVSGGNWFRQLPQWLLRGAVARWERGHRGPFVMYFHTWELDTEQPRITAAPVHQRVRQYRNLGRMPAMIRHYLTHSRFTSISDYLGLAHPAATPRPASPAPARVLQPAGGTPGAVPLTVVVPCHNEELILPYLANTLRSVAERLAGSFDLRFVFVDDGSTDATWASLQHLFGGRPDCQLIMGDGNRGVAAAIQRGIQASTTALVASIDCDCTYDPHELAHMVPLLADGVDMVTASPYHPQGGVLNVPGWRLLLSRRLSSLYRLVLRNRLFTYTSCFRVYRRDLAARIPLTRGGFLGVTELLGRIDVAGGRIVEYPTTLRVRIMGRSKMRIVRTIAGHLRLLAELAVLRLREPGPARRIGTAPATVDR